ncbi:MAG: hypothetical protein EB108_03500 [Actinobacteria bacterium]|nr:hypothetical protein [Actinomycetota bacterium]
MLFWFIATAVWSVWFVFRDPKFDYRLVAIAALVPDLTDGVRGAVGPMHSVVTSIAVLFAIMIATAGRKPSRQRLLAIPIGMFIHLIFDGAFSNAKTFWWPLSGFSLSDDRLPSIERGLLNLPLEIVGIAGCLIAWRYFSLADKSRRADFLKTGSLRSNQ